MKEENNLDFLGEWKLENDFYAIVNHQTDDFLFGVVLVNFCTVPTWWFRRGNSKNMGYNLKQKRRSAEENWPQESRVKL